MARTKNILIFCVMLLTIIIAGCSKEEKKENETSAKAKRFVYDKTCNGRNDSEWYAKKSCCFNK